MHCDHVKSTIIQYFQCIVTMLYVLLSNILNALYMTMLYVLLSNILNALYMTMLYVLFSNILNAL